MFEITAHGMHCLNIYVPSRVQKRWKSTF